MKKIAVGLSGGVDSCTAAYLLREQGYEVMGITLRLKQGSLADADIADARRIAEALGIELEVLDLREYFKEKIIEPFVGEYLAARTPNPCIECNGIIKFGAMLDYAVSKGCNALATGHYAKIEQSGGRFLLKKADSVKDQSYFLYRLTQAQLSRAVFPLAGMDKTQIRAIAESAGLPVAKKHDSQEICFVPNDDYSAYLASLGVTSPPGDIVDGRGNVLGTHNGIINYTVGQRKGLGAYGKPMFVTGLDSERNAVVIGENGAQYGIGLVADRLNLIDRDAVTEPFRASVRIRFRAKEQPALIIPEGGGFRAIFDEPQRSITPGQSAVIYDGETVVGGGRIISQIRSL